MMLGSSDDELVEFLSLGPGAGGGGVLLALGAGAVTGGLTDMGGSARIPLDWLSAIKAMVEMNLYILKEGKFEGK